MAKKKADWRDRRLGLCISEARERIGLTQEEIGSKIGLSKTQIHKYERGTNRISAIDLDILSRLTNTPITEFLAAALSENPTESAGLEESAQAPLVNDEIWSGLATVVARHVHEKFSEGSRREFAGAIAVLNRELISLSNKSSKRRRSVKRTGSANRVDRPE